MPALLVLFRQILIQRILCLGKHIIEVQGLQLGMNFINDVIVINRAGEKRFSVFVFQVLICRHEIRILGCVEVEALRRVDFDAVIPVVDRCFRIVIGGTCLGREKQAVWIDSRSGETAIRLICGVDAVRIICASLVIQDIVLALNAVCKQRLVLLVVEQSAEQLEAFILVLTVAANSLLQVSDINRSGLQGTEF